MVYRSPERASLVVDLGRSYNIYRAEAQTAPSSRSNPSRHQRRNIIRDTSAPGRRPSARFLDSFSLEGLLKIVK